MKSIFTLRGIAIACVVLGHAIGWVYLTQSWYVRDQPVASVDIQALANPIVSPTYQVLHIIKQLTLFDVPAFLFASGFFLAVLSGRAGRISYKAVGTWIRGLLFPFLIWVSLNTLGGWLPLVFFGDNPPPPVINEMQAVLRFLYFIPLIFQFYLLGPVIIKMAQENWKRLLLIAAALQLTNTALWYVARLGIYNSTWLEFLLYYNSFVFISWAFYFPLGAVCGLNYAKLRPLLHDRRAALIAVTLISGALSVLEMFYIASDNTVIIPTVNSLSSIVYAVSMTGLLLSFGDHAVPYQKQWMNMGARSLGIYLSHTLVLVTTARLLYHLVPVIVFQPILLLAILFTLALVLPYLFGELLYRYARSTLYQILFG